MVRLELVGADRGDQEDAFVAQVADEEGQQVPRRRVGPLEVLDDEHGRRVPGEPIHDTEQDLEQADLREAVVDAGWPMPWAALAGIGAVGRSGRSPQLRHQPPELGAVGTRAAPGAHPARARGAGLAERPTNGP